MVRVEIPVRAIGKQRPRFANGRVYTPAATQAFENFVRTYYMHYGKRTFRGPVRMVLECRFRPPASASKKRRQELIGTPYTHKPDADNCLKAVQDALNGIAYDDDAQICEASVSKRYADKDSICIYMEVAK